MHSVTVAKVIGLSNNKGGVGKTSLTALLAASLSARGKRVLCVDMDPQANLTRRLGYQQDPANPIPTLSEAIKADQPGCAADIVLPCRHGDDIASRIFLLPSRFDLENRESEAGIVGAKSRLANVMKGVTDDYDYALYDLRPSLGHLVQMSMVAIGQPHKTPEGMKAGSIVIVTTPEFDAMLGAQRTMGFVEAYRNELAVPELTVSGVIINMVRKAGVHNENLGDIRSTYGDLVIGPELPLWSVLTDADNNAEPLRSFKTARSRDLMAKVDLVSQRLEEIT